jgi:hypothetical protein
LADFEELFAEAMRALEKRGLDFTDTARQTLIEVIGLAATEPLYILLGDEAFRDPELFAERAAKYIGHGSLTLCKLIAHSAIERTPGSNLTPAVKALESDMNRFEEPVMPERKKQHHRHDHRNPDDFEEYRRNLPEDE